MKVQISTGPAWGKYPLRRGRLDNICNELDEQALALALRMKEKHFSQIVIRTMGLYFAEEVLRYALSIGANIDMLLTYIRLSAADTPVTTHPLAQAIRKNAKEIFNSDKNYIIVSGMRSVGGDTALVPSQKRRGSLQLEILEIIWNAEETTMRYITEVIAKRRPRSVNTIPTAMKRLTDKGLLSRTTDGKNFHYRATVSREYLLSGVLVSSLGILPDIFDSFTQRCTWNKSTETVKK